MGNIYKEKFNNLISSKKNSNYEFFIKHEIEVENKSWTYLEFNVDQDIYNNALELAAEKSKYTMSLNQNQISRSDEEKIKKQTQGILAEIAIHLLIQEEYLLSILRFDLERENFEYTKLEYDLKMSKEGESDIEIEVRSSNAHSQSIVNFIVNGKIIGGYGNSTKPTDEICDFHFRPMFFPKFTTVGESPWNEFKLYLFGCATKKEFEKFGYKGSLGQSNTTYMLIDNTHCKDMDMCKCKFLFNTMIKQDIQLKIKEHDWKT